MAFRDDAVDFSLAVTAWKTLWLEARTSQERFDLVWQPTQHLLDELSDHTLTCFAGKYYMFPRESDGVAVNLFLIGGNQSIVYLGTLFNQTAYTLDRAAEKKRLTLVNLSLAQQLATASPQTIVRDAHFCKIPADSEDVDTAAATKAVRRYLAIRAPHLAHCTITWLSHEDGIALEQRIRADAERTAEQPNHEDRLLATAEDELELW